MKTTKKKLKSLPKLKKDCEKLCNEYIRLRDKDKPCISCGEFKEPKQAGHFFAVGGYDGLRFNENNIHGECQYDNLFNESHLIGYAINLKARIGESLFEILLQDASDYKRNGYKWSRSEIEDMIEQYKSKIKELKG